MSRITSAIDASLNSEQVSSPIAIPEIKFNLYLLYEYCDLELEHQSIVHAERKDFLTFYSKRLRRNEGISCAMLNCMRVIQNFKNKTRHASLIFLFSKKGDYFLL
jgi:hypothetical protein